MKTLIGVALALAAGAFLLAGCGSDGQKGGAEDAAAPAGTGAIAQKTCPVMEGNRINPKLYVDHNGRRVYFCCKACVETFRKDPEKYVKKVDEQLAKQKAAGSVQAGHEGHSH